MIRPGPASMTIRGLNAAYASGERDPVEIIDQALAEAARPEAAGVFIRLTAERARAEAAASRLRWQAKVPLGPLDGLPIAWKDLVDQRGEVTSAGSRTRADAPPAAADAPIMSALARAGTCAIGRTNLSEFAFSGLGLNPHFGTPANALAADRIPGGSSSGSAVAVALGLAVAAIATDTSGSVRVPAALNGLVGYKPTTARIDRRGVYTLSRSLDSVGPIGRSVEDVALIDAALRNASLTAPLTALAPADLRGLRVVAVTGAPLADINPAIAANHDAALRAFADAGARVEARPIPEIEEAAALLAATGGLVGIEAYASHRAVLASPAAALIDPNIARRLRSFAEVPAHVAIDLLEARERLSASLTRQLDGAVFVMPTTPMTAPLLAPLLTDPDLFAATNRRILRNTMIGSFLNTPGVTLPAGCDGDGLPTGILISAATGADDMLLRVCRALESALSPSQPDN